MPPESTGLKLNSDEGAAAARTPTLRFKSEARLGSDGRLPVPLVFKGRIGPSGRPPLSLRAQPCEVSQPLTIIRTPVLNNLLQDKVALDLWNDSFLKEAALLIASLRQQENTEEKQVQNVLKFFLTCVARHDTSALKLSFSCNLVKTNPDLNGTKKATVGSPRMRRYCLFGLRAEW